MKRTPHLASRAVSCAQPLRGAAFRRSPVGLAAWLLAAAPWALALPQGAVPNGGQATLRLTAPGELLIQQSTATAGLDWTSFSIAAGERVQVQQPSASAVLLNRVLGDNPSAIHGALSSNGSVWLINPQGIVFGAQSRVDVGSLVASTLSLSPADAAAGRLHLRADTGAATPAGALVADGTITASNGTVVLVAPQLTQRGSITAHRVGLAAGSDVLVDLEGDGLVFFHVRNEQLDSALNQLGRVRADGGTVDLRAAARAGFAGTVLNLEGVVQARSLGQLLGRVAVDGGASGITRVAGTLDVTAPPATGAAPLAAGKGGDVLVQGHTIALENSAVVDASGAAGGGSVRIGGDFQGANAAVRNAERVVVMPGALLAADGLQQGDGGRVIVWSDTSTHFLGSANARGGALGGDGGLVEVSGKAQLDYRGHSDRSAPLGRAGRLLLDPENITVRLDLPDVDGTASGLDLSSQTLLFADPGATSVISAGAVAGLLATGPVELQAQAEITVTSAINQPMGTNSLSLRAGTNITIAAPITVGGGISLSVNDPDGSLRTAGGRVEITAPLTAGGAISISNNTGGTGTHRLGASLSGSSLALTGNTELTADSIWTLTANSTVNSALSGAGALTKSGAGVLTLAGAAGYTGATRLAGGGLTLSAALASTVVEVNAGTLTVAAADVLNNAATVTVAPGANLTLNASDTVTNLVLRGTLAGGAANTWTTTGTTTLNGGTVSASLAAAALTSSGASALLAPVTVTGAATVTSGSLTIGNNGTAGELNASGITVAAGASLVHRRSDAVTLGNSFSVTGPGQFAQTGSGSLVLGGGALQLGTTDITASAGGLVLAAGQTDRIADSSAVSVNGSTLTVNSSSETIAALTLVAATVDGSGALSTGLLTSSGASRITTTVNSANVNVGNAVLSVGNGGASGALNTTGTVLLSGSAVLALERAAGTDLSLGDVSGSGTISQRGGNTVTLTGFAPDIRVVDIRSGTLRLAHGAGDRINDAAAVTVANGATMTTGNAAETVGTLTLAGTLNGSAALTANTYTLQAGAVVNSALGGGEVRVTGSANLNAAAAALQVNVLNGGSLTLGAAGAALNDAATVSVNSGGTLTTTAAETIGSLNLAGTLSGASALTAATTTLQQGGLVSGALGAGALLVTGTGTITGTAASTSVAIASSGRLVLGATEKLTAPPSIGFGSGGRLTLNGDQTATTVAGNVNVDGTGRLLAQSLLLNNSSIGVPLVTNTLVSDGNSSVLADVTVNTGSSVNSGVLTVGNGATSGALLGAGSVTMASGTTLAYDRSDTVAANTVLGNGRLRQAGSGELQITSTVTASAVEVTRGTLSLAAGNNDRLSDSASLQVANGATFRLNNSSETVATLSTAGQVAGSGLLTAASTTLQNGAHISSALGGGSLSVSGNSTMSGTSGAQTVQVQAGTLTLASAQRLSSTANATVASGATLRLTGDQALASFTTAGALTASNTTDTLQAGQVSLQQGASVQARLGTGPLTVQGDSRLDAAAQATVVTLNAGTLTLGAPELLSNNAAVTIATGAGLTLGGTQTVASLASSGTLGGAGQTLVAGSVTLGAGASVVADLNSATLTVNGNSRLAGTATATSVNINGGTLTTAAAQRLAANASVTVASGAFLALGGDQTVAALALGGTLTGSSRTLTAATTTLNTGAAVMANLGPGSLVVAGDSSLTGSAASGTATINPGATLTLMAANRFSAAPAVTVNGRLSLTGEQTLGTLAGSGSVDLGSATVRTGSGGSSTFSGSFSGRGGVDKRGAASTFTLTAAQAHTGSTTVSEGTLVLAGNNLLAASSVLAVAPNARLTLGGAQNVQTLNLAGSLVGSGSVSAPTYNLDGGQTTAGAALGAGTLHSTGNSQLAGSTAAGAVLVDNGTLTLASAGRFTAAPAVTVASGASLLLGGAEQAGSLVLTGNLNGSGQTLAANTSTLNSGAVLNANLGGGTVSVAGDSSVNGRITASTLVLNAGTLSVAASADRIADSTALTVASGARLLLAGAETVGSFAVAGTLASTPEGLHRLTASGGSTLQTGAQVLAPLGGASLRVTGDSRLAASTDATTVAVEAGQLTLSGAERLADTAAVAVARSASLVLDGAERVGTLQLAGTLQGAGTLSATRYTLDGGTVLAALAGGSLVSSGSSRLQGFSAADEVLVEGGTLTLSGAHRLSAAPALNVASGATVQLQGDLTVGALAGSGSMALGVHALRVGQGQTATANSSYSGTISGAVTGGGSLYKVGAGRFTFNGSGTSSGSTVVEAGTLQVGGTLLSTDVQVASGATLALSAAERLADSATVSVASGATFSLSGTESVAALNLRGRLDGSGLLQAPQVLLDGATVVADLGSGALRSSGASTLSGHAAAATVLVADGSLALASAGRLARNASVTVARGATLQLGGDTTVASLALAGSLTGLGANTGTLTAAQVLLDGGTATAALGAGALRSTGNSTLGARSDATSLGVDSGNLALTSSQALVAAPATTVAAGATLQLAADQTLGSLAGSGTLVLGPYTLTTGSAGSSSYAGQLQGSGKLVKTGSSEFTLTGNNTYTGSTTVLAGTLTVGDGATSGSLASSALVVNGTLKMARSDAVTLAQPISGSGVLEQAGSGRLTLAGSNKTYSGNTRVSAGELTTANAEALPGGSAVQVAAGASLSLGGAQTLRSITSSGNTTLAGNVTASEDLLFNGPVVAAGNAALQLSARRISASHAGNRWGTLSLSALDSITLSAGSDASTSGPPGADRVRDLTLADVSAGNGGRIEAGVLTLSGVTIVSQGALELLASGALLASTAAASADAAPKWDNKVAIGLPLAPAAAVVQQTGGRIQVASGAQLQVQATQGGSVLLTRDDNQFVGGLQVLSGAGFGTAWATNTQVATPPGKATTQNTAVQSLVQVHAGTLNVGGRGIEADVVSLRATTLATPASLAPPVAVGASALPPTIVARLPFDNTVGTAQSLPALTLWLNEAAFALGNPYGSNNGGEIHIDVGSRAFGAGRSLPLDAGYITVLPRGRGQGSTSVQLVGPKVSANGYRFYSDGAGVQSEIAVFYNGVLPVTPQVESSISAIVAVSEGARRERFEEAVRTENVAVRLRAGVIAEVGPGRPATQGTQGAESPASCAPAAGSLLCAPTTPQPAPQPAP